MNSLPENLMEYRKQLEKGAIQAAYRGLMEYLMNLRTHLKTAYPDHVISGSLYAGYMDMTYCSFFPKSFHRQKLKVAIVFTYEAFRFEVWLAGVNKQVQGKYWQLFKESDWKKYPLVSTTKAVDSIIEHVLVANPDFRDLDALTRQIERGTLQFIQDIGSFLSQHA